MGVSHSSSCPWWADVKYILVLQWPANSLDDFDALVSLEDQLEADIPAAHGIVDGHDFGAGEMNIFIYTDRPLEAFQVMRTTVSNSPKWVDVRAAYRRTDSDRYAVIWPKSLDVFSVS